MELKSREFHYGESVDTRYFKFKVKRLSKFNSPIAIKLNGGYRDIYEGIIKGSLKVSQLEEDVSMVEITFRDSVRERAIKYIDNLTDIFIKESILNKSEQSNRVLKFINGELERMRRRLEESEKRLESYRVSNDAISPSTQASTLIKDLSSIDIKISQNMVKRELIDSLVALVDGGYSVERLAPSLMQLNERPTLKLIELLQKSEMRLRGLHRSSKIL